MKLFVFALLIPLAFAETVQGEGESRQLRGYYGGYGGYYGYGYYNDCYRYPYSPGCHQGETGSYPGYYYPGYRYPGYQYSYYYCLRNPWDVQNCPETDYGRDYCYYNRYDPSCPDYCRIFPGYHNCPGVRPPHGDAGYLHYLERDPDYYLNHCEGDCDTSRDCVWPLVCYQRHHGYEDHVPGCLPSHAGEPHSDADYCVDPADIPGYPARPPQTAGDPGFGPLNALWYRGNDHVPKPLGECQGDCDNDNDCRGILVCHLRTDNEPYVPGCYAPPGSDEPVQYADYCVLPY